MQAGPESHWSRERHPAQRPWPGNAAGNANENSLPMRSEKDIRLFQTVNIDSSTADNLPKMYFFSELPTSATYLPNTSYNKSSQSLSETKYGSHVRKIQNLLQEMEQDEEQRLAQIRRDSKLLLNPNYNQKPAWPNTTERRHLLPPVNRSGSLGRYKSSPSLNNAYTYELQNQDKKRSHLSKARPFELEVPYEFPSKDPYGNKSLETQLIELEVPSSATIDVVAELDVPYTMVQPHERSQGNADSQLPTTEELVSSFADVDLMISNSRSFYNNHRSSLGSSRYTTLPSNNSRNHRLSKSLIELDASPPNLVAELPVENYPLSPVEQRSIPPSRYGDRRFRTLPGEAYPLIERESPSRIEQEPQRKTRTKKQSFASSKINKSIQPSIDPRTGLPYTGTSP